MHGLSLTSGSWGCIQELEKLVITLEEEMFQAAEELRFEYAAKLRDEIKSLRRDLMALSSTAATTV